ncbi:MAG: glycosyltransferase [Gemmataceae bacterium]|nr:glycosyltransferase [Gemmataceae bacterium]
MSSSHRLLAAWGPDVDTLDLDLFLRYSVVARLLNRMIPVASAPARVLEVGCHGHNVLRRLLDPALVQVDRCDIERYGDDPDFFVIPTEPPWPIPGQAYDAVVALEVLEHLPRERRRAFLAECLRVARHGAIFTCPNGVPEVIQAETIAATAYELRHGLPHPFLSEHKQHGLPTEQEICAHLRAFEVPHAVRDNAPVDGWLATLLVAENLTERAAPRSAQAWLNRMHLGGLLGESGVPYRKIYVCAKTSEASAALEAEPPRNGSKAPSAPPLEAATLQYLAMAAGEALCSTAQDNETRFDALLADHRADLATLQGYQAAWLERYVVLNSFVQSLRNSRLWKLLEPIRVLRRLVRPRGFGVDALVPGLHMERDHHAAPGTWTAGAAGAHFTVPCALPAGPLRIRLKMTSEVPGQFAIYSDNGTGCAEMELLDRFSVDGALERTVRLPRPALALRFEPLGAPGRFRLETLDAAPLSPIADLWQRISRSRPGESATPRQESKTTIPSTQPIIYVLKTVGRCGGVKVVLEHVSRLKARGHDACVYYVDGDFNWFPRPVAGRQFADANALKRALAEVRGIKVATWHETAPWVADALRSGDRGYYLVQDIEESYANTLEEKARVLRTYALGLTPITEGLLVRDQLKERFGRDSVFISIGLDFDVFHSRPAARDPNLILTQARTITGGGDAGRRLKGWETARAAVLRCHERNAKTSLLTFSMEEPQPLPRELAHVHVQSPNDARLARLYSRAGLYLMSSTHEGFGLPAAEAMACGCPVVATRAQGNEEFCIDSFTALLAPVGDAEELAKCCLRLQSDPVLAAELARNGQELIRRYTWDRVIDRLESEFLHRPAAEIVIAAPDRGPMIAADDAEYPALPLDEPPTADWTVIVPTVNDVERVVECITSCRRSLSPGTDVQFIVVDDGSRDPAVLEKLRHAAPELGFELLCNHQNLGFSATVNHGLRQARGRYVLLCNNDVAFEQPCLEALAQAFERDEELGILGGRLLYPDGTIQHAGMVKVPGQLMWIHACAGQTGDVPEANHSRDVWSVTGALFALRRQTLADLGGLSTAYATAYEDVDYCLRAWTHGIRVGYCADAVARHHEGCTRGATDAQKRSRPLLWAERERAGRQYFEKKWVAMRYVERFEELRPRRVQRRAAVAAR